MAKSTEWFQKCFLEASKKSEHEYGRVQVAVREAIRNGEADQEYLRNQFGYHSDLVMGATGKTRKEFFNGVFASVVREMREKVMFAAMNKAWGVNLQGISGLKTYLSKYTEMTERGVTEIKVLVSNKADRKILEGKGIKPVKGNTYLLKDTDLIEFIGNKIGMDLLTEESIEVDGEKVTRSLDMDFQDEYERKLTKLIPCRTARLSSFGVEDDFDYDAL